jgi:hypothetical protein
LDAASGDEHWVLEDADMIYSSAFSEDGRSLAVAGVEIRVCDPEQRVVRFVM